MSKSLLRAACAAAVVLSCIAPYAAAQQARSASAAPQVAIIDLNKVFKEHAGFKAETERMKAEVEAADAHFKERRDTIQKMAQRLEAYEPGSADYRSLEESLTKDQAALAADVNIKKKQFMEQEASMYYRTYQEVSSEVEAFANAHGIMLVLRFNGDTVNPDNPQEVLKEVNKQVVFHHPHVDITPYVLERINGRAPRQPGAAGVPPAASRQGLPTQPRRQ